MHTDRQVDTQTHSNTKLHNYVHKIRQIDNKLCGYKLKRDWDKDRDKQMGMGT